MTEPRKILVNTEQFKNGDALFAPLVEAGYTVEVNETFRLPSEEELIEKLKDGVVATIAGGEPYTARVLETAPHLKIVARWGVGYDKVDVKAPTKADIPVAMALTLACRIGQRDAMVKSGKWFFDGFHQGLWGRTAGIIGLGRIGGAMARRCVASAMDVLVFDHFATDVLNSTRSSKMPT